MSIDGAERRKQRIDELLERIRECGDSGISHSAATAWASREQGIRENTAREHIRLLESCGEIRFDNKSGKLRYVQRRSINTKILETP